MLISYNYPLYNPSGGAVYLNKYKATFIDLSKVVSRSHSDKDLVAKIRAKYFKPLSKLHKRSCTVKLTYSKTEYQWLNSSRSGGYDCTKTLLTVIRAMREKALPGESYKITLSNLRCLND